MIGGLFSEDTFWMALALQSTICIAAGLVGSFLLRRRAARAHPLLLLGMLAAVVVPALSFMVRHYELGIFTAGSVKVSSRAEPLPASQDYGALGLVSFEESIGLVEAAGIGDADLPLAATSDAAPEYIPPVAAPTGARFAWGRFLVVAWIAASTVLVGRLLLTFILGIRLLRGAQPVESSRIRQAVLSATQRLAVGQDVQVRHSGKVRSPVIWCWAGKPTLLIPDNAERLRASVDWAGVFCHELAHWRRLDHVSGLLAELVVCVAPWHPLMWWAKRRLMRLSEQACDDWVVACGQTGTDYAESLLDLSPERQLAFLPTVVGKERGLQERIRRIVRDGCGNPRIGVRWALVVGVAAMCAAVTVAFAQERPAEVQEREEVERLEREESIADQEAREHEQMGAAEIVAEIPVVAAHFEAGPEVRELAKRRSELAQELRELERIVRDTERELEELGEGDDDRARALRAELEALQDHVRTAEQELHGLDQERPMDREWREREDRGRGDAEERAHELMRRREELQEQARNTEQNIAMMSRGGEAMIMLPRLREIYEQLRAVDRELHELEWAERAGRRAQQREPRERDEAAARAQDLTRHRARLQDEAREIEAGLGRLEGRGRARSEEAEELRARLHEIRAQIQAAEQELRRFERDWRPEPERAELESRRLRRRDEHLRELMRKRDELRARASHIEPMLDTLDDQDEAAKELRKQLRDIHEKIEAVERQMHDIERDSPEFEPARRRGDEEPMGEPMRHHKQLAEQAREIELVLRKLAKQGDEEGDEARQLRAELEHIREQMRAIERELRGAERDRPREQVGLEHEVQQLRGQVGELRHEMGELRRLLEQLLQREHRRPEKDEHQEPQRMKEVF